MPKTANRLECENLSFSIGRDGEPEHSVTVNIGRDASGNIVEVAFCEAGKIGHGLHLLLADLGIKLSRALQNRHPETGAEPWIPPSPNVMVPLVSGEVGQRDANPYREGE